jgi:urea transport system substrate-binding protein
MPPQTPRAGRGITRRQLMQTSLAVGVGGAVVGAGAGYTAASVAARGAAGAGAAAGGGGEIRVVGIFPLTGFIAADGKEMRNGTVMAIDEINEQGGLLGKGSPTSRSTTRTPWPKTFRPRSTARWTS